MSYPPVPPQMRTVNTICIEDILIFVNNLKNAINGWGILGLVNIVHHAIEFDNAYLYDITFAVPGFKILEYINLYARSTKPFMQIVTKFLYTVMCWNSLTHMHAHTHIVRDITW